MPECVSCPHIPPPQLQLLWERLPGMLAWSGFLELLIWQPLSIHNSRGIVRTDTFPRPICPGTKQPRLSHGFYAREVQHTCPASCLLQVTHSHKLGRPSHSEQPWPQTTWPMLVRWPHSTWQELTAVLGISEITAGRVGQGVLCVCLLPVKAVLTVTSDLVNQLCRQKNNEWIIKRRDILVFAMDSGDWSQGLPCLSAMVIEAMGGTAHPHLRANRAGPGPQFLTQGSS